ncbi:MAG TPA: hypothetical protein VG621_01425 [Candidatus Paceibacterota bacterium]|nr:hypothetical protein [Candidatus Paceibacterota bacterium]
MFGLHTRRSRVLAVYDISSGSVGGAHVLLPTTDEEKSVFLTSVREASASQETLDVEHLIRATDACLERVIAQVRKEDVHHPEAITVLLSSPWYRSQTHTIVYKKPSPFTCTRALIEELIEEEIKTITAEPGLFGAYHSDSIIIEKQLSAIKLNGYVTDAPYDKETTSIECSLMLTIAPTQAIKLFSDTLRRSYGPRPLRFTTNLFATFIVMRDVMPLIKDDGLIMDVGEEVTDSAFIEDGVLLYQHSFPVGTENLYRALGAQGVYTLSESRALFESYRLQKLAPTAVSTITTAIATYVEQWKNGLQHMLVAEERGAYVPETILIVADERFEQLLVNPLTIDPLLRHYYVSGPPHISFVAAALFDSLSKTANHGPRDIPLSIGTLFAKRLL